ncbi:hypothetical protein HKI87_08g51840 [Chloropicon roscoffensis]|uniref:F-box domain-containing protein n=1 Tax=Chloropicon roscoffensis TaxID=1461544 RepID=A0AAX4PDE1_9CHLO
MGTASSRGRDEMARGEGEPSAKRAKVGEEEDPLVRRKEEVVRLLGRARKGKDNARAKKELLTLCSDFEAKNEKLLRRLPPELWQKILDENLHQNDVLAFAMTCRFFRDTTKDLGKKLETNLKEKRLLQLLESGRMSSHSMGWFRWVCDTFEILTGSDWGKRVKGAVYEGDLLNYAALQGSVETLRWLMEEKGWELNLGTSYWAGRAGSIDVLEYLWEEGYDFDVEVCTGAAQGGHLEALKFLRGVMGPPCPWDGEICAAAAEEGHLEVLKWARSEDPPCPWSRSWCRWDASENDHQHIVTWIDQQEDESDVEDFPSPRYDV